MELEVCCGVSVTNVNKKFLGIAREEKKGKNANTK
jgi:hypothetical protein